MDFGEALNDKCDGSGGSARQISPACSRWAALGLRFASKRVVERAQGKGNSLPGLCGAEIGCSTLATARYRHNRRRSAGDRRSST